MSGVRKTKSTAFRGWTYASSAKIRALLGWTIGDEDTGPGPLGGGGTCTLHTILGGFVQIQTLIRGTCGIQPIIYGEVRIHESGYNR
jgi:hypothetical protein